MEFLTTDYIKAHSRIDIDDDDTMLAIYGESAEEIICQLLNRGDTVTEMVTSLTSQYGEVPKPILHAGLMLVDLSYQHHSPISQSNMYLVPYTFDFLIKPYMVLVADDDDE